jgi:hypothetical protein
MSLGDRLRESIWCTIHHHVEWHRRVQQPTACHPHHQPGLHQYIHTELCPWSCIVLKRPQQLEVKLVDASTKLAEGNEASYANAHHKL